MAIKTYIGIYNRVLLPAIEGLKRGTYDGYYSYPRKRTMVQWTREQMKAKYDEIIAACQEAKDLIDLTPDIH